MSEAKLTRIIEIFTSRLLTLKRLLDMAAAQWRETSRDPEAFVPLRLVDDMLPLPYQIAFACKQAKDFTTYVLEGPGARTNMLKPDPSALAFTDLTPLIDATLSQLDKARKADPVGLAADKRVEMRDNVYLELPGAAYFEDWLIPNFYFHLTTAYDILRQAGVRIGKPDYMAHLAPYLRGTPQASPAL